MPPRGVAGLRGDGASAASRVGWILPGRAGRLPNTAGGGCCPSAAAPPRAVTNRGWGGQDGAGGRAGMAKPGGSAATRKAPQATLAWSGGAVETTEGTRPTEGWPLSWKGGAGAAARTSAQVRPPKIEVEPCGRLSCRRKGLRPRTPRPSGMAGEAPRLGGLRRPQSRLWATRATGRRRLRQWHARPTGQASTGPVTGERQRAPLRGAALCAG